MDIILYNPLSKNGNNGDSVLSLIKSLDGPPDSVNVVNILEIMDIGEFIRTLDPKDRLIIVGGDGTVHKMVNRIHGMNIPNPIYIYGAGTGNDFVRSLKSKNKIIRIDDKIKNVPYAIVNGKKSYFINGVGIGLDGLVCYKVNSSTEEKNSWNYFRNTVRAFMESKKIKNAKITIDGKEYHEKRVWLCSIMNDKYLGGGMKLAPKARRENKDLYLVVVKNIPKILLIFILPTVYMGLHKFLLGFVKIYKVEKEVSVEFSGDNYLQMDGEVEYPVTDVKAHVYEDEE